MADSPEAPPELSEEQARRLVLLAVGALVVFLLAASVAAVAAHRDRGQRASDQTVASGDDIGASTGPLPGTDLTTYVASRTGVLPRAKGTWAAVVSFAGYASDADARARLRSVDVQALLVAPPGGAPEAVSGDLGAWAQKARADAQEERANLQSMANTTDDTDFKAQFQADIARLDKLLAALNPNGPVVFGAVVVGQADDLRALASTAGVRLVDLVGRRPPASLALLRGVRPEEAVQAGRPPTRPA
ncbi:MAG TPA: hypothetical protein VFA94_05390 [Acidimicrobiales bacterium]|nr:hypothetical protein [Acidimicrobiales bacterium]